MRDDRTVAIDEEDDLTLLLGDRWQMSLQDMTIGTGFDLTNRYSSPGCLLFFLNEPHSIIELFSS